MRYHRTLIRLTAIAILSIAATAIHSQAQTTTGPSALGTQTIAAAPNTARIIPTFAADDVCEQRLAKALASLDLADVQIAGRDKQIAELNTETHLQDERFVEVLAMLKQYATLDAKEKKGWWKKLGAKLLEKIDQLTDPKVIAGVMEIVVLSKAIKQ